MLTTILSVAIHVPTTLQALAHRQRQRLLFFRMSRRSLKEFREYYETTALKWVTNLSMFCARVSRGQRTNLLPCSAEVLFTRSAALIANFVYYGQTDRALETRLKEHKRAVRVGDNNSNVAQHANQFGHSIDLNHATIVDKARNFHERLFLEAWYSQRDNNAGNEHIDIPDVYKSLA